MSAAAADRIQQLAIANQADRHHHPPYHPGSNIPAIVQLHDDTSVVIQPNSTAFRPAASGVKAAENDDVIIDQDGAELQPEVMASLLWGFAAGIMVTIILSTIFGNVLVIVSVLRISRLRVVANSFIVSLAVADLLVALLVMTFSASQHVSSRLIHADSMR